MKHDSGRIRKWGVGWTWTRAKAFGSLNVRFTPTHSAMQIQRSVRVASDASTLPGAPSLLYAVRGDTGGHVPSIQSLNDIDRNMLCMPRSCWGFPPQELVAPPPRRATPSGDMVTHGICLF